MFNSTTGSGWLAAMKRPTGLLLILVATSILTTGCIQVQSADGGFSMMSGTIHVEEDEVAREDIVAIGGSVIIDGRARRDVVVIGGRLTVNGEVEGDVSVVGGTLVLGPGARIEGDAVVVGGSLRRHDSARIGGEHVSVSFGYGLNEMFRGPWFPIFGGWWGLGSLWLGSLFVWLLFAFVTVALAGDRVSAASHAIARDPLRLWAIGLVGFSAYLFVVLLSCLLIIVLIGIPIFVTLLVAGVAAYIFSFVAMFQAFGTKVMRAVGRPEASQIAIVLVGGLLTHTLTTYVPLLGFVAWWFVLAPIGFGAVLSTRFGTGRRWVQGGMAAPAGDPTAPVAPAKPAVPVEPEGDDPGEIQFDEDSGGAADMEYGAAPEEGDDEKPERRADEE